MSKKLVKAKTSASETKADKLLSEFAEKYEVALPKLKTAYQNIVATFKEGTRDVENRAIIKLLGEMRAGRLVDTEPVSFVLFGLTGLNDSKDFQVKTVTQFVRKEVPKVLVDLESKGVLDLGYPVYKSAAGPEATLQAKTKVYHTDRRERAIKDCGEKNLLTVTLESGTVVYVNAIDDQETFAKSGAENPNYKKAVLHNYSRRYLGFAVRHREDPIDDEGNRSFVPSFITTYGDQARELLPFRQHIDYDVKVSDITNDKKEVEMYAISIPEFSKATKIYPQGEAAELMGNDWLIKDDDDLTDVLDVLDAYYERERVVDYDKIHTLFGNRDSWVKMIKETIPRVFTGYFQVVGRSQGAIFADTVAGRLIDAENTDKDVRNAPAVSFQTCSTNPLTDNLAKGDVIKAAFYFNEQKKYDFESRTRTQELEPVAYLLGWSWEYKAGGESFIEADEISS